MTLFRPVIDLHQGRVKQIVGGTLTADEAGLRTHFVSDHPASYYAKRYRRDGLRGGHVIMLGPGNEEAAAEALRAYPGGLHVGGGIRPENAGAYLAAGAERVIVTSYLFQHGPRFDPARLEAMAEAVGVDRLVVDLSCRRQGDHWVVATDRWQTVTELRVDHQTLNRLAPWCAEFLIHAADVEGTCGGIDEALVGLLGEWGQKPVTYAGGARSIADLERVSQVSQGRVDLAIGSALDLFGGSLIRYEDCVRYNRTAAAMSDQHSG
jgi:phosphoribosylformimino-5-aminoimidazole carboxamide ribotide isomerase